ncbi:META domain-containing protein [Streptomyces sp. NPDC047028]|uniref:META domain-containing protein n=1 Tax=Streptomyces sp. NPDC047028 TaxID=3155793 RepID=UPI0033D73664
MNRHKQHIAPALVVLLVPLAAACAGQAAGGGSGSAVPGQPVTGVDWTVDSVTAGGTTHRAPPAAHPRLRIDADGRASGNLGCNRFSATATVDGDRVRFGQLRTTKMACDEARTAFERVLGGVLGGGTFTARTDHSGLTLSTGHDRHAERVDLSRAGSG